MSERLNPWSSGIIVHDKRKLVQELTQWDFPTNRPPRWLALYGYLRFSFWEEKLVAPLIAAPNGQCATKEEDRRERQECSTTDYTTRVTLIAKRITILFANKLDEVLIRVTLRCKVGLRERKTGNGGNGFWFPPYFHVLNSRRWQEAKQKSPNGKRLAVAQKSVMQRHRKQVRRLMPSVLSS